ncbi:hypothetical protein P1X14_03505 [Sphingomonas sp. AOB5]|uniref:hypothetical protein n=1 Tax=Sphingomonas sp. AOB5 TaxID=3034017 RepID=UPI0023F82F34|nr:hypothetical protein [Sphingomonas sp. AOB5]MDF7774304.1 hypothetical protein [Sphingomonas sp. AOB5]
MIDHYDWAGGREAMLCFGPDTGPVVVAALPLFEEANRTRAFVVTILRALAERGIASALPDLPGTGESLLPTEAATMLRLREAYQAAAQRFADRGTYAVSLRSGTLLDALGDVRGRWHLTPQTGSELLRELTRIKQAEVGETPKLRGYWYLDSSLPEESADPPVAIAGNLVSAELLTDLGAAIPFDGEQLRTVRLETDPKPADLKAPGSPLWRRAEPDNDPTLAELLAVDIAAWVRTCEG